MADLRIRRRRRLLAIPAVVALIAGGSVIGGEQLSTASAQALPVQQSASRNWAGYVAKGTAFSSVSGSWVVPTAKSSNKGYSAAWVGLGGASRASSALEQVGTESDYTNGRASYTAWYELVPKAPVNLNLSVKPGDQITGTVTVAGTNVTVSLANLSTGRSVTKSLHMSNPDTSSAEWIAEAPSVQTAGGNFRVLPLANFGKVSFTNASATAGGHTGSIRDAQWTAEQVRLLPSSAGFDGPGGYGAPAADGAASAGSLRYATTSTLGSGGSSFSVSFRRAGGSAPGMPGGYGGGLRPGSGGDGVPGMTGSGF